MKVYLAGEQFEGVKDRVKRRLFSYWYNKGDASAVKEAKENGTSDCFLDSGAFTAFTQKAEIDPGVYAKYIRENHALFTVCSSLDAIGDPQQSYDYLKQLEALGCVVSPVFHAREDIKWLKKYIDEGYEYIFLGGMVPETTGWLREWLDGLFDKYLTNADGTARVKLHGFGLTDQQLMFRYPWHSVDSTSWLFTGAFGGCLFYRDGAAKKVVFSYDSPSAKKLNAPHYSNLSSIEQLQVDKWLAEMGVTAQQCAEHYSFRNIINADSFQRMEKYGTETFKKKQVTLFT